MSIGRPPSVRPPPPGINVRPPPMPGAVISSGPVNYGAPASVRPANGLAPGVPVRPHMSNGARPPPRPTLPLKRPREPSPPPAKKKAAGTVVVQGSAIATVDKLKIKKDYVPKALRAVAASSSSSSNNHNSGFTREQSPGALSVAHSDTSDSHHKRKKKHAGAGSTGQICPRCGETIPHDQLEQHMRIELLDPKWREQREKEIEWKRTKNLDDAAVAKVLTNISEFRTDIFDEKEAVNVRQKLKEIEAKMAAKESRAWDGHTATARTVADNLYSSLTPEERERDFLRRRGQLIEGTIVGVQAPEGFSDRRPFEQRQFHQGQMPIQQQQQQQQQQRGGEEYPEWFRDPSQMLAQQQADASAYYSYYGANAAGAGATAGSPDETGYAAYDASWYSGEAFQGMAEQKEEETS